MPISEIDRHLRAYRNNTCKVLMFAVHPTWSAPRPDALGRLFRTPTRRGWSLITSWRPTLHHKDSPLVVQSLPQDDVSFRQLVLRRRHNRFSHEDFARCATVTGVSTVPVPGKRIPVDLDDFYRKQFALRPSGEAANYNRPFSIEDFYIRPTYPGLPFAPNFVVRTVGGTSLIPAPRPAVNPSLFVWPHGNSSVHVHGRKPP